MERKVLGPACGSRGHESPTKHAGPAARTAGILPHRWPQRRPQLQGRGRRCSAPSYRVQLRGFRARSAQHLAAANRPADGPSRSVACTAAASDSIPFALTRHRRDANISIKASSRTTTPGPIAYATAATDLRRATQPVWLRFLPAGDVDLQACFPLLPVLQLHPELLEQRQRICRGMRGQNLQSWRWSPERLPAPRRESARVVLVVDRPRSFEQTWRQPLKPDGAPGGR